MPDSTVVLVPLEPPTVIDLDRYADRIITTVAAIPLDQPLTKTEQVSLVMARAWTDNPYRSGPSPVGAMLKAA